MKNDEKVITSADFEGLVSIMSDYCKFQCEHDKAIIERLDTIISLLKDSDHKTEHSVSETQNKLDDDVQKLAKLSLNTSLATEKDHAILLADLADMVVLKHESKIRKTLAHLESKGIKSVNDVLNTPFSELCEIRGLSFGSFRSYGYGSWDDFLDIMIKAGYELEAIFLSKPSSWRWIPISSDN